MQVNDECQDCGKLLPAGHIRCERCWEDRAAATLPPFTGELATCPKCAHGDVSMRYQPGGMKLVGQVVTLGTMGCEWFLRECDRCNYRWAEHNMELS